MFGSTKACLHQKLCSPFIWKSPADIGFDSKGIVLQDGVSHKQTVTVECHAKTLKTGEKLGGGTRDLDETVAFVSRMCMTTLHNGNVKITDIGRTSVEHPPYGPDLTPCDFWAFPMLKYDL
jgi:hypothetical protein